MPKFNLELLNRRFYFPKESVLQSLNKEQQIGLLKKYYSDETTVTDLIKQYNLKIRVSDLNRALPYLKIDEQCPYDGKNLYQRIPSKSGYVWDGNKVCFDCGHTIFSTNLQTRCNCPNCMDMRLNFQEDLRKCLDRKYPQPVNYETTSLYAKVLIAALLQSEYVDRNGNIELGGKTYGHRMWRSSLNYLIDNELIIPSSNNDPEDFVAYDLKKDILKFEFQHISWRLNVSLRDYDETTVFRIVQNVLQEFITDDHEMEHLKIWLVVHSFVDEIQNVMELAFDDLDNAQVTNLTNRVEKWLHQYSPIVVETAFRQVMFDNDELVEASYDEDVFLDVYENKLDWIGIDQEAREYFPTFYNPETKVFFTQVYPDDDWMNQLIYFDENKIVTMPADQLDKMLENVETDESKAPQLLDGVKRFAISDRGVVLEKTNGLFLISNELAVYTLQKSAGNVHDNWWSVDGLKVNVEKFYSLGFILKLVSALSSSKIPQKNIHELI